MTATRPRSPQQPKQLDAGIFQAEINSFALRLAAEGKAAKTIRTYTEAVLRLARLGAFDATLGVIRAEAEADAARKTGDHDRAARHEHLAASYWALRDHYQQQEQGLARAMTDRQEWEQATAGSRRLAIAADTELRRRHPHRKIEPLRAAGPAPGSSTERQDPDLTPQQGAVRRPGLATSRSSGRPSAPR
jgi:hypothetical protein